MKRVTCVLFLVYLVLLSAPVPAMAQEPTPTPTVTPTPAYMQDIALTSGNTLHVERTIQYGDAAVVVMLLVLWITLLVGLVVIIPKLYLGGR